MTSEGRSGATEVPAVPATSAEQARRARRLPLVAAVVGVWALLPPFVVPGLLGAPLNTELRVEIADHVVPAFVLLGVAIAALVLRPRRPAQLLVPGLLVVLAGVWMTATHLPLVNQALAGAAEAGPVAWHTVPGLAVLSVGLVWTMLAWSDDDE